MPRASRFLELHPWIICWPVLLLSVSTCPCN